jgi:PleD family two-component response regulator
MGNNIKRFKEYKEALNENANTDMDIRGHVAKIMNALYGMDEKYEDQISTSFNEKEQQIKIVLDDAEETANILMYLDREGYNTEAKSDTEILIQL